MPSMLLCACAQEHAYYGSFGYHVTNMFAASSRSGTPEELKVGAKGVRARICASCDRASA